MKLIGARVNPAGVAVRVSGMGKSTRANRVLDLVDGPADDLTFASVNAPRTPFEEFYLREFPRLRVLARALVGPALADDVAQEAMVVAYGRWATVAALESPGGWVRLVCARKAISMARRRSVEQRVLGRLALARTARSDDAHDDDFWVLVRRLPARQAQAVALYYALDLPVAEVASTLGCTEGTVKVHLSRARAALEQALGVEVEEA